MAGLGWRRALRAAPLVAASLIGVAPPAGAHGGPGTDEVVATLDAPRTQRLKAMRIELHRTLAYQLLVENRSGSVLEVLGRDGVPFIRIGPEGVEANLHSTDWYSSYAVPAVPPPSALRTGAKLAPRWQRISRTQAWGWFDPRLQTAGVKVAHRVADAGQRAALGRWRIPVHVDGRRHALTGRFWFEPPPAGHFEAQLAGPGEIAPGVLLQVLPGPVPGLFVQNDSAQDLTLMDAAGKPFVRVGPAGVHGNTDSVAWQHSGQAEVRDTPSEGRGPVDGTWQQRSPVPRFSWIEPRAAYPGRQPPGGAGMRRQPHDVLRWEIAYRHGDSVGRIVGVTRWIPAPASLPAAGTTKKNGTKGEF